MRKIDSVKLRLVLLVTLPLLALGSAAGSGVGSGTRPIGVISARGEAGIYLVDPRTAAERLVPGTARADVDYRWSPDGRFLAFDTGDGDEYAVDEEGSDVYTVRADGTELQLVLGDAWSPSWSPDGKRLVVVHGTGSVMDGDWNLWLFTSWNEGIYTVRADGSDPRRLTSFQEPGYDLFAVSPNGKGIAYSGFGINLVRLDGSGRRRLVGERPVRELTWSPDGEWLAFATYDEADAYRVRRDGGGLRRLGDAGHFFERPAWSPDGSMIAFDRVLDRAPWIQAMLLDVETGKQVNLTPPPMPSFAPAWSPDGKQLVFLACTHPAEVGGCGGDMAELWVTNADGSGLHRLAKGRWGPPTWLPAPRATPTSTR